MQKKKKKNSKALWTAAKCISCFLCVCVCVSFGNHSFSRSICAERHWVQSQDSDDFCETLEAAQCGDAVHLMHTASKRSRVLRFVR